MRKIAYILCTLNMIWLLGACGQQERDLTDIEENQPVYEETEVVATQTIQEATVNEEKIIIEKIKGIDFNVEYPINTELFDAEMEEEYKAAFYEIISSQTPLSYEEEGAFYFRQRLIGVGLMNAHTFEEDILRKCAKYRFVDCDGDGLPELAIEIEECGDLCILKYNSKKKCVDSYRGGRGTLLGSNQSYYWDAGSASFPPRYEYVIFDKNGQEQMSISFQTYYYMNGIDYFSISMTEDIDGETQVYSSGKMNEATWNEVTDGFFEAVEHAPEMYSFDDFFGEDFSYRAIRGEMKADVRGVYEEFLRGERNAETISMQEIIAGNENDEEKEAADESNVRYVIWDVTGDGIPELHIQTKQDYYILKYEKDILFVWKIEDEPNNYRILKNGTTIYCRLETDSEYYFCCQQENVEEKYRVRFERIDRNKDGIYDENDRYLLDDHDCYKDMTECAMQEWQEKAEKYLCMDKNGKALIEDQQVEWVEWLG